MARNWCATRGLDYESHTLDLNGILHVKATAKVGPKTNRVKFETAVRP